MYRTVAVNEYGWYGIYGGGLRLQNLISQTRLIAGKKMGKTAMNNLRRKNQHKKAECRL